jgi:3-hydroxyacyl-[acyl-carrier-protein] dehydratase
MRFLFYDKVVRLEKNRSITGIKVFALSEEFHRRHFGQIALVPGTILIEAMAQILGWLICYSNDFKAAAIMSVLEGVTVSSQLRPGFQAEIHGEITSNSLTDSMGKAWMEAGGARVASIDRILYSHFSNVNSEELARRFRYFSGLTDLAEPRPARKR